MCTIPQLLESIHQEARAPFPIDTPVYEKAGKDPLEPILFAGSLTAPLACSAATWVRTKSPPANP